MHYTLRITVEFKSNLDLEWDNNKNQWTAAVVEAQRELGCDLLNAMVQIKLLR